MSRSDTEAAWQSVWLRRGVFATLLYPLSRIYGALARRRRQRYLSGQSPVNRLPVPVVVVGNVVVGGAGKTPTVLALLQHLKAAGWRPGVVSRGHGRRGEDVVMLGPDTSSSEGGDEPTLIRRRAQVPVCVGPDRAQAAKTLLTAHDDVDILVCDDGLQHLSLGRDVGIVVFDDRGVGNGWLLPAGLLREPWPPLADDAFTPQLLLRPSGSAQPLLPPGRFHPMKEFVLERRLCDEVVAPDGTRRSLESMRDLPVTAVAGIARPQRFFEMLRERGLRIEAAIALPDHASPQAYDVLPADPSVTVLCTEKDAVKLIPRLAGRAESQRPKVWVVALELHIDPAFFAELDRRLAKLAKGSRLSSADGHQTA